MTSHSSMNNKKTKKVKTESKKPKSVYILEDEIYETLESAINAAASGDEIFECTAVHTVSTKTTVRKRNPIKSDVTEHSFELDRWSF